LLITLHNNIFVTAKKKLISGTTKDTKSKENVCKLLQLDCVFSFVLNKIAKPSACHLTTPTKPWISYLNFHQLYVTLYTVMVEAIGPAGLTSDILYTFQLARVKSKMPVKC
jgi:hypothetical protein